MHYSVFHDRVIMRRRKVWKNGNVCPCIYQENRIGNCLKRSKMWGNRWTEFSIGYYQIQKHHATSEQNTGFPGSGGRPSWAKGDLTSEKASLHISEKSSPGQCTLWEGVSAEDSDKRLAVAERKWGLSQKQTMINVSRWCLRLREQWLTYYQYVAGGEHMYQSTKQVSIRVQ